MSSLKFVFDNEPRKARAEGAASGDISGQSDNFLLENFKPLAKVQLVTSTDNFANRVIQILRRDCSTVNTTCPANVLIENFIFSKNKLCTAAASCSGYCVQYLTDGNVDRVYTFQLNPVHASSYAGFTQNYTVETPAVADYGATIGAAPLQAAFLYIQAQEVVVTVTNGKEVQTVRKANVIPNALTICFPDCGNTCGSGFQGFVDDETVTGGVYVGYATAITAAANAVFPFNLAGTSFRFLHLINASITEKTLNYNSAANQIPHAHLRFEWQAFSSNRWRTVVVQYQATSTEGCVVFPCLSHYLDGYAYTGGDALDGASEFRLAVSRYATATDAARSSGANVAWKDMPAVSFTLAEISMTGTIVADPSFNDPTAQTCPNNTYIWTVIAPHEEGVTYTTAASNAPDATGRLTMKQLDGSDGQILEVQNYSTATQTYRVHVISPNVTSAAV